MYLNRSLFNYKLILVTVFCFGFHTMLTFGMEVSKSDLDLKDPQRVFATPEEANNYSNLLMHLFKAKKYKEVLELSFPEPVLPKEWQLAEQGQGKISRLGDYEMTWLESYRFQRAYSLAKIYHDRGHENTTNPVVARKFYQQSLDQIAIYISSPVFGVSYESPQPEINVRLNQHRAAIYGVRRDVYYNWSNCETHQNVMVSVQSKIPPAKKQPAIKLNCETAKKMLLSVIDDTKEVMTYTQKVDPNDVVSLRKDKLSIGKTYLNIISYCDETESKDYLDRARQVSRELAGDLNAKFEAEELKKAIEFYTEQVKPRQYQDNHLTKIDRSGNLKHLQHIKENNDNLKMLEQYELLIENPSPYNNINVQVVQRHNRLTALVRKNINDPQIIPLLKELETVIQQQLMANQSPSTLIDIYHSFAEISQIDVVINEMIAYFLPAFLKARDFQGALNRFEALSNLELERRGKNSGYTRWLRAAIKNLYGDHSEWEEIEQEIIQLHKENQEKKDAEKKLQEQQYVARMKKQQLSKKAEKEKQENDKPKVNTNSQTPKKPVNTEDSDPITNQEIDNQLSSTPSLKEHKEAKMKRHEEAEKQREAENNQQVVVQEELKSQPNLEPSSLLDHIDLPKIRDVYKDLSKNSKLVDAQIENDTWIFSRENLIRYFRNLDCIDKPGGKHPGVSLPETTIITFKGKTIAIFNELGGALTLPRWDKSTGNGEVPNYLRTQILKAREKLVQLKLKANHELKLLQEDLPQSLEGQVTKSPEKG